MDWPPAYTQDLTRRATLELALTQDAKRLRGAQARYAEDICAFANDCCWLHEPRNANIGESVLIPVVLFPRQEEFLILLFSSATLSLAQRLGGTESLMADGFGKARPLYRRVLLSSPA